MIPLGKLKQAFLLLACATLAAGAELIDYNRQIQPILSDACFRCHGPDAGTREADLRLDLREGLFRTKNELTVVKPGKPEESELYLRITSPHEDEVMPPKESNRQLRPGEAELIKKWIASGAPWGTHWAFSQPSRPILPKIEDAGVAKRVRNPIDAFVFAKLEKLKLQPAAEAERATLLRRVALDLTGVAPTPTEMETFLADKSAEAYERAVDRLLGSPRYGERWAWEWLDLARYADTNGFQGDPERTMWPWRDWVVNALNANMPYDQFSIEQLAGDMLPEATREQKLASGFHRNNMFNGEGGRIAEETRVENVFDRVDTTATVWLGLTYTCSRCHDHKFDPITQKDYYAMYDIFNQMSETGAAGGRGGQVLPNMDMSTPEEQEALRKATAAVAAVAKEVEAFEVKKFPREEGKPMADSEEAKKLPGNLYATHAKVEPARRNINGLLEAIPNFETSDPAYAALLKKQLAAVRKRDNASAAITRVMIMDTLPKPRETYILNKGIYEAKTDVKVIGAVPSLFAKAPDMHGDEPEPARLDRLGLAKWLMSPENPLAARTAVNRAWLAFWGTGLVKTAEDFGVQSEPPSHPELLDWLATEFVASGWDVKALHRLIVTSATYRQSSRMTAAQHERDPENRLLARGPRFRMPSWMIRDNALSAAGLLVDKLGGPAVKPYQPPGIWEEATFGKKTYTQDHGEALYRRSLYIFWRRIVGPTTFFDAGARQVCTVQVARTNTPLHALVTLNDPAYVEAARVMAQRVLAEGGAVDATRIGLAFRLATGRAPIARESAILGERLGKLRGQFASQIEEAKKLASAGEAPRPAELDPVEHAAWTALCSLILNLDEALSKE